MEKNISDPMVQKKAPTQLAARWGTLTEGKPRKLRASLEPPTQFNEIAAGSSGGKRHLSAKITKDSKPESEQKVDRSSDRGPGGD
jgi:hypothetical protein